MLATFNYTTPEFDKQMIKNQILQGDALEVAKGLASQSVNCIMTSPAYWGLRDYGTAKWEGGDEGCDHKPGSQSRANGSTLSGGHNHGGHLLEGYKGDCQKCGAIRIDQQLGLEETPEEYVANLVEVFRELRRALRDDGTLWLNLGDSYANVGKWGGSTGGKHANGLHGNSGIGRDKKDYGDLKTKDLVGIPWMVAFALRADGWYLRSEIIWAKTNPMPESVSDRPTKAHEQIFLLTKSSRYYYDQDAIREPHTRKWDESNGRGIYAGSNNKDQKQNDMPALPHPQGRNRRTVWTVPEDRDPLLSYLIDKLATDDPERLQAYLDQYEDDDGKKSDVFEVSTKPYKGAHFAVFPAKLIEPCILAGCPSKVCVECGEPWVRVVEKEKGQPASFNGSSFQKGKTYKAQSDLAEVGKQARTVSIKTLRFAPTCQCNAAHRPGIVLDPFFGSGTVAEVAIKNKRDWLGIELNPDYIELAKDRIYKTQPALFTT